MKHLALLIVALSMGCKSYVVRDGRTYNAELDWFQQAGQQTAELAAEMVARHCTCKNGYFEDLTCEELADNIVTIQARMEWHVEMARYNARLIEERPPETPPDIPEASSLCPPEETEEEVSP